MAVGMEDPHRPSYRLLLRDLPASERPRERLRDHGSAYLSNAELVAILLRTGTPSENVIDLATGWKADFIIRKDRPFSREEFGRRQKVEMFGTAVFVATAEDTVVAKLEWARLGQSERQLRDVAAVVEVSGDGLDFEYVEKWVVELGLEDEWGRVSGA